MKKILSIVIGLALLATQFVVPTFASENEIKKVTVTANNDLIEFYSGMEDVVDDEDVFVYDTSEVDFWFDIEMTDGEKISGNIWKISEILQTGFSYDPIVCKGETHVGTYDVEISCEYFTVVAKVNIIENPVAKVEAVATKPLYEETNGSWQEVCLGENCDEYFEYNIYDSNPYFTITYKDGTVYEGYDEDIREQTGFYTFDISNQEENRWQVGSNTAKVSFLDMECEFQVEVLETPVQSISVETTYPLYENYSGYMETIFDEDGNEISYFEYYVLDSVPVFTVTLKDGTVFEGTQDEIYTETGIEFYLVENQAGNPWTVGMNTTEMLFYGYEFSFQVEVVANPVASVTGEAMYYLVENHSGLWQYYYDEYGNESEFFWYDIYEALPVFTITYKDGSAFTGTDEEIFEKTGVWTFDETDQGVKPWATGENTAKMSYLGYEFDVNFEVVESPVESVEITEENGLTIIIKYKDDDAAEKLKAIDYVVDYNDRGMGEEYIITDARPVRCSVHPYVNDDGSASFYITVLGKNSNSLDNFDWFDATLAANGFIYSSLIYATGSEELYEKKFEGYNSADVSQDLTQLVALSTYICEMYPDVRDEYFYHSLDVDTVKENIKLTFGLDVDDLTSVDGYNSKTDMISVYEPIKCAYEYEVVDMNLVDGKWEKVCKVNNIEADEAYKIKVVLNADYTVDRIVFGLTGDLTGDGKISAYDARQILKAAAETIELNETQTLIADANYDGNITAYDARMILQAAAGLKVL